MNAIGDTIHGINIAKSENPLRIFAIKQLDSINNTLNRIHQKGVIFARSPDSIRQMIDAEKYVVAIVESDKFLANLVKVEKIYDKATAYRTAMPDQEIVSLHNAGKYALVIKVYEQKQAKIHQINKHGDKPWKTLTRLNENGEKNESVPDSIKKNLQTQDIGTHERANQQQDTEQLFSRLHTKAEKLTLYAPLTTGSFTEVRDQITTGRYDDARKTLRQLEDPINALLECESSIAAWKAKGYNLTELEGFHPVSADDLLPVFQNSKQNIDRLEVITQELESKKRSSPNLFEQPEIASIVLSIEQNRMNPDRIDTIEKDYQQLNNAIRHLQDKQKNVEQNIRDQGEKLQREAVSPATNREIQPIIKSIRQNNIPHAQELLKDLAGQQLTRVNAALSTLRTEGVIVTLSSDTIQEQIAAQHYGDAILDSEQAISELTRISDMYAKAKIQKSTVTEPATLALFENGKYEEFIRVCSEEQERRKTAFDLKKRASAFLKNPGKFGRVPTTILEKLASEDISDIENAIKDLDAFFASAQPVLTLTLDQTRLTADKWHKVGVQITNNGDAHAFNVSFSFSSEFDTRWIKPTNVEAGKSTTVEIGILPKKEGSIPLEITVHCRDGHDKTYDMTHEFWIDVIDRMSLTPEKDAAATPPQSPVSRFTPKPLTPKQLPPELSDLYTESEFIGKGGFARVFKAKRKDGKLIAVKIPISLDASTGRSFIAEMQNWTKLDHPNIVRVFDYNIMPMPYFEEELCDSALSDQTKPIESEEAAWIIFNICEGLKFAHDRKIIHRDLKPQNILLKNGVPKISDWGLSRIISESTTTSATSFTPYYAAPEQINNRAKDERTDIWQLGVILYELVTGVLPFKGDSMVEIGMIIATKDPKCPGEIIPNAHVIDTVVMKCLQKDPKKRYPSVLELQKDLALYLRENYTELLKTSLSVHDYNRSAYYCGDLVMINMLTGDIPTAYKYLLDLVHYSKGDVKAEARELSEQIKMRMDMGVEEIPDELIQKAEHILHQMSVGFRKRG